MNSVFHLGLLGSILHFSSHHWLKRILNMSWLFLFLWNRPKSFSFLEWAGETGTSGNPKGEAKGTDPAAQNPARWPGNICLSRGQLWLPSTVCGLGKTAGEQTLRLLLYCLGFLCPFPACSPSASPLAQIKGKCCYYLGPVFIDTWKHKCQSFVIWWWSLFFLSGGGYY